MIRKLLNCVAVMVVMGAVSGYSLVFASTSSSPDRLNKSTAQQCGAQPNYGSQIDFEGHAPGTPINLQYLGQGVKFGAAAGGPVTEATFDGARPGDLNILVGRPLYTGDIHASFWTSGGGKGYVTQVGATVGYLDALGTIFMHAYDCDGNEVDVATSTIIDGVEFMSVSANEIHKVIFLMGGDPAGSDIDCFTYDTIEPCEEGRPGINKDVKNIGTETAYDLSVVVKGLHSTDWRYMGWSGAVFQGYFEMKYPDPVNGPHTKLTWHNLNGSDDPIPPGSVVHVGWRLAGADPLGQVLKMFWTDINGDQIACSHISQTNAHLYYPETGVLVYTWPNRYVPDSCYSGNMTVTDLKYLITDTPLDLNGLNRYNDPLNAALIPIPGSWPLAPGESFSLQVPEFVPESTWVTLYYKVTGQGASGENGDYVQYGPMSVSDDIPTLTEWGMIIFCALLFAWMAWVLVRRRKQIVQSC